MRMIAVIAVSSLPQHIIGPSKSSAFNINEDREVQHSAFDVVNVSENINETHQPGTSKSSEFNINEDCDVKHSAFDPIDTEDIINSPPMFSSKSKTSISVVKKLFSSRSPIKNKIKGNDKSLQYAINIITELNVKVNTNLIDLNRKEEILQRILEKINPNDDNSIINDINELLEGFPIDDVNDLKNVNRALTTDKSFYKQLIKMLKEFRGSNVNKVTKSIMNVLFTNNLGKQISLTGKGLINKQEKEPLKTSMLFKLITGVIIKNIKDSTVPAINKAVSGWLKHSKERQQRYSLRRMHTY